MGVWNKHRYGNQGIVVCPAGDSSIAACSRRRLEICETCRRRSQRESRTGGRCASTLCLLLSCRSRLLQPWRGCTFSCLRLPLGLLRRPPLGCPLHPSLHSSPACGSLCCPPCSCPSCCLCSTFHCSPTCSGIGCPSCSCSSSSSCLCSTFHSPSACCLCCPPLRCPSSCLQCTFHSSPACQCRPHLKPGQCCPPRGLPCHPPCRPYCQACCARTHLPLWYRPPRITLHCLQQGS